VLQQIPLADVLAFTVTVLESGDVMLGQRIEIAPGQLTAGQAASVISSLLGRHPELAPAPAPGTPAQPAGHAARTLTTSQMIRRRSWSASSEWCLSS
jgi:hypothetical protein